MVIGRKGVFPVNRRGEDKLVAVSIVLPAYDERESIESALHELDRQSYMDREIIVVDDGSSDGTSEKAIAWAGSRTDARVLITPHSGPSHARNFGARESNGGILFFAESDCVYSPDYLVKAVEKLKLEPESSAVCLTGAPLKTRDTLATACIEIENRAQHRLLNDGKIKPFYAWVFKREAFFKLGGYDEKLFQGEDKDFFRRFEGAGFKVAWVPGIHWWHKRDQTTWSLARKWFARGRTRVLYSMKHKLALDFVRSIVPVSTMILGIGLLFLSSLLGEGLILLVFAAILVQSARVARFAWRDSKEHSAFLWYPLFVMTRNFATGLGYFAGLFSIALGRKESF